jgi:hypothetical protein
MRIKPKQLFRAFQKGLDSNQENLGDFAILKADALGASVNPGFLTTPVPRSSIAL